MSEELRPHETEEVKERPEEGALGCHEHHRHGHGEQAHHCHEHGTHDHHHECGNHHHGQEKQEHHEHGIQDHHHEHGSHNHCHEHGNHDHHHEHEEHDHQHDFHEHNDHDHDHGHTYEVAGYRIVETHRHEGATICSFEKDLRKPAEEVRPAMENAIGELEKWLEAEGALIGHVKGYIREAGPVTTFSTTGSGLHVEIHEGGGLAVGFAAIVFGPEEEVLKEQVLELFRNV